MQKRKSKRHIRAAKNGKMEARKLKSKKRHFQTRSIPTVLLSAHSPLQYQSAAV
jgi:hypothetical protein